MGKDKKYEINIELIAGNELKYGIKAVPVHSIRSRLILQSSDMVQIVFQYIKMKKDPLFSINNAYSLSRICDDLIDEARTFYESGVEIKIKLGKEK